MVNLPLVVAVAQVRVLLSLRRYCSFNELMIGMVRNVTAKNVHLDRVNLPLHIYQTNGGHSYVCSPSDHSVTLKHEQGRPAFRDDV